MRFIQRHVRRASALHAFTRPASTFSSQLPIVFSEEVRDAIASNRPLVALESTIATHGLPYPESYTLPLELESIIRQKNAVPATIAIMEGKIKIGLTPEELLRLVTLKGKHEKPLKLSRRDIASALVHKRNGSTTVASTMFLAHQAGIKVFCTGGSGGVHRGAFGGENSLDVSADLTELSRTPVTVVCAGVKSILDIGRTLEWLETQGVTVATLRSPDFPAFYSRSSGFPSPLELSSELEVAELIHKNDLLRTGSGILLGVPIPHSEEKVAASIQESVEQAVKEAELSGMATQGKRVTPWLLSRVKELTGGTSVQSNIALIKNNAVHSALIATAYNLLANEGSKQSSQHMPAVPNMDRSGSSHHPIGTFDPAPIVVSKVVVVGSAALDLTSKAFGETKETTSPGICFSEPGGVGRNIAEAASRLMEHPALLVSSIGTDLFGSTLKAALNKIGLPTHGLIESDKTHTAVCNSILDAEGSLICGVADMTSIEQLKAFQVETMTDKAKPDILAFDGNLSSLTITELLRSQYLKNPQLTTFFEPTSTAKALRILPFFEQQNTAGDAPFRKISHVSPNKIELEAIWQAAKERDLISFDRINSLNLSNSFGDVIERHLPAFIKDEGLAQMAIQLVQLFGTLWIKLGSKGLLMVQLSPVPTDFATKKNVIVWRTPQEEDLILRYYEPLFVAPKKIVSVTGAGDSCVGALIACLQATQSSIPIHSYERTCDVMAGIAQEAATLSMQAVEAVNPALNRQLLIKHGLVRV